MRRLVLALALCVCIFILTGCKESSNTSLKSTQTTIPLIVYSESSEEKITARPAYLDVTNYSVDFSDTELFRVVDYFDYVCMNWDGEKNIRVNMRRVDDIIQDPDYTISNMYHEDFDKEKIYGRNYEAVLTKDDANKKSWIEFSLYLYTNSGPKEMTIKISYEHLYENEEWITFANLHYDRKTNELMFLFAGSNCHVAKVSNFDINSLEWSKIDLSSSSEILPFIYPQTSYFLDKKLYVETPRDMLEISLEDMSSRTIEGLSKKCQDYVFKGETIPSAYDRFIEEVFIRGAYKDMLCLLVAYSVEPSKYPDEYERKEMYLIWRNDEIICGIDVSEDGRWEICDSSGKIVRTVKTKKLYNEFGFDLISFSNY